MSSQSKDKKFYYSINDKKRILIKANQPIPEGYISGKGTCWVNKDNVNISIDIWEKQAYINNGFKQGRL